MTIKIVNMRNEKPVHLYDFEVDRSSPVGNKFFMKNESYRDKVCDKYEEYFTNKIKENEDYEFLMYLDLIKSAYKTYGTVRLFCWCYPKRCHSEIIKKWLEKQWK